VLVVTRASLHVNTVVLDERVHVCTSEERVLEYTLFSVLVRRGEHYYAYVKEPTAGGGWHKFDDMSPNSYAEAVDDWDDVRRRLGSSNTEQAMTLFYRHTVKREREASAPTRVALPRRSEAGHGIASSQYRNLSNAGASSSSWRSLCCPDPDEDEDEDVNGAALIERSLGAPADEDEDEAGVTLITQGLRGLHHGEAESAAVGGDGWVEVFVPTDAKNGQQ